MAMDLPPPTSGATGFVYVPVPVAQVEDTFRFLAGLSEAGDEAHLGLERVVKRVYLESEERFRDLLRFLAGHPGRSFSTADIAEELRLPNGAASLAGMLGAFARRSKNRYDGFWPFERLYNSAQDRAELVMEDKVAALVNAIPLAS